MHQLQQQQRTAAALAARPLARSMLVPRSSPISPGAIAGAVVGSVVGALLIAFCVFPFIVRARRRRLARHDDPGQAEMGQGPGGPIFTQDLDDSSYKRSSGSGPENGTAHDISASDHKPQSSLPPGVTVDHGLPSPVSSPTSPTDPSSRTASQTDSPLTATAPNQSPIEASSQSRRESRGTVGRESTREVSVSDSHGPPSRQLTGIASVGITEEPESFDQSGSPESGHFSNLKGSLRSLIHRRRSSHQRQDSKRSTTVTDGARSPSVITNDFLPQSEFLPQNDFHPQNGFQPQLEQTPSGLEIDTETPGLAWDYYHDPTLGVDLPETYPQPTSIPTSVGFVPPAQAPTSAPLGSLFPAGQIPVTGARPITEEPDALSPESEATVTPGLFSRQNTFLQGRRFPEPLQRTDSLPPPTIVADLPSPPLQYNIGPSGNPMEMMKPTNSTENAWMLEHEMRMIHNSPPQPALEPIPSVSIPVDEGLGPVPENDMKSQFESQYHQSPYQTPYQSPPYSAVETGMHFNEEAMAYYEATAFTTSDYSTPPASTGPSTENTPDTRLTPFTASPSPPAEIDSTINTHLTVSPGLSAGLSPSPGLSPSSGLSPSPGLSAAPSPAPGRSPARPPGGFVCQVCGAVKSSFHQFNHHRRYHDRPFPCSFEGCERSFGTITHLKRHVNDKHEKTRKFYCTQPGCDYSRQGSKSFPRKDNWKRHMLKKHSIDPQNVTDEDHLGDVAMDGS